jgi:lipopolysaccharide export system permease protein
MVTFLSSALGGSFRKNILLMSLLSSLVLTVIYYVFQMVMVIFANLGFISPMAGAWAPFIFFSAAGIWLFRIART